MSKHTPGDWTTHKKNGRKIVCGDKDIGIAASQSKNPPEAWANARMMAAAPDLLEALRPFANFACSRAGECDCYNCRARDAIAKAEGVTP